MQKQGDTMAEVTYRPAHVKGEVRIPPSKSAAHRALLSAALCKTPCRVGPIDHSADMEATLNGVCAMGGTVKAEENRSEERRVGKECRSRWSPYH